MAMIDPTDEMRAAFDQAPAADVGCYCAICLNHRLAAVLAIVERDRCLKPRGHVFHPLAKPPRLSGRGVSHPHFCVSCSDGEKAGPGCANCRSTGFDQSPWPDCEQCRFARRVAAP
jgi:hypothetical protein